MAHVCSRRGRSASLQHNLPDVRTKNASIKDGQPQLACQLAFLLSFYLADPPDLPEKVRRETVFALLYAAKGEDLVPDAKAGAGYLDDAAVAESVLSRHDDSFATHCDHHRIEWAALKPTHLS